MKKIPLTQGQYALVDDADYDRLRIHKWCAVEYGYTFYARRKIKLDGNWRTLRMHRLILGLVHHDGKETDHIDGNGLNNQRSNLRVCSRIENSQNRRPYAGCSSQYKGVHWDNGRRKWRAEIKTGQRKKIVGRFNSQLGAAVAYNRAARELFGEYARLNELVKKKEKK